MSLKNYSGGLVSGFKCDQNQDKYHHDPNVKFNFPVSLFFKHFYFSNNTVIAAKIHDDSMLFAVDMVESVPIFKKDFATAVKKLRYTSDI